MNPLKPFFVWLRPHLRHIVIGILLIIGVQAVGATIPMLLKWAIDAGRGGPVQAQSLPDGLAADLRMQAL